MSVLLPHSQRGFITGIWYYPGINSISFKFGVIESKAIIPLNAHLVELAANMSRGEWAHLQRAIQAPNQWVDCDAIPAEDRTEQPWKEYDAIQNEVDTESILSALPRAQQPTCKLEIERWVIHSLKTPTSYVHISDTGMLTWISSGDCSPTIFHSHNAAELIIKVNELKEVEIVPPPYDCMVAVAMHQAEADGVDAKEFGERLAIATGPVELRPYVGDAGKRMAARASTRGWFLTLPFGREILEHETPK